MRLFTKQKLWFSLCLLILLGCHKEEWAPATVVAIITHTSQDLRAVHVFENGRILVTGGYLYAFAFNMDSYDDGMTWNHQLGFGLDMEMDMHLDEYGKGLACDFKGHVYHTENEGYNWTLVGKTDSVYRLKDVFYLDEKTWFASGAEAFETGMFGRTTDGGAHWQWHSYPYDIQRIYFFDENKGFACGYGSLKKTNDGGNSWTELDVKGDNFVDVMFVNNEIGYLLGYNGVFYKTLDGGKNWKKNENINHFLKGKHRFRKMAYFDAFRLMVVGDEGIVAYSNDAGDSWMRVKTETTENLYNLETVRKNKAFCVGNNGTMLKIFVQ